MHADQASSARACSSPPMGPSIPSTDMRSPTKIRTPIKLVRPRETHWASKAKKRLLDAGEGPLSSALPPPKRVKLSHLQPPKKKETQVDSGEASGSGDAVEAEEDVGSAEGVHHRAHPEVLQRQEQVEEGYVDGLHRRVQVAQALEEDLLRDNARMRLKAMSLREEVDFYYGMLARIEVVAAQQRAGQDKGQVTKQLQRIISAPKPVDASVAEKKES
ncbi:hypothetical protein PRIC1_006215 [Phytophthora ramorum]